MTLNKLASEIAKREGKKSQARIGDIREIIGVFSDICHEELENNSTEPMDLIVATGEKRAKKKKKK